jgi:hypothetical protein
MERVTWGAAGFRSPGRDKSCQIGVRCAIDDCWPPRQGRAGSRAPAGLVTRSSCPAAHVLPCGWSSMLGSGAFPGAVRGSIFAVRGRECAMPRSGTIEAAQPWGTSRVRQPASLEWPRLSTLAASTSFLPASRLTLPSVNTSGCRLRRGPTKAALPRARPRTSRAQLSPFDTKWRRSRRRTPCLVRKPALPLRPDPTGSRRTPGRRSLTLPRARQRLSPLPQSNAPPPATSVAPGT